MNAFVNHKRHLALQKGMKKLLTIQNGSEGKITASETQMVSIALTTLNEIEKVQTDIAESNKRL